MKKTHTILDQIVENKAKELIVLKTEKTLSELRKNVSFRQATIIDFEYCISGKDSFKIIAEIKKASPSVGVIRSDFDHVKIAQTYEASGLVDAISIITESKYFQGKTSFINELKNTTTLPILRKDFIFDEYQIYESYLAGADAILLIVAILSEKQLEHLMQLAHSLGMSCLVEAHSKEEIKIAIAAGAKIIGINSRNLRTFTVNNNLFNHLVADIPDHVIKVAESGISSKKQIENLVHLGFNAALIGTTIMKANNVKNELTKLLI